MTGPSGWDYQPLGTPKRRKAKQAPPGPDQLSTEPLTEDAAALEVARRYATKLLYDHDRGSWYVFEGSTWRREGTGLVLDCARSVSRGMAAAEDPKVRAIAEKTSFAKGVEQFVRVDRRFAVTADVWDSDPFLLGTPGDTMDLRTGRSRAADAKDRITKTTAVVPAETAACPLWRRFLLETAGGDLELVRFLQQWCGYALTGDTREHALVFGYGTGGNGKSVFLNTVTRLMGDYSVTAPMDVFTASQSDRHPTDLAMLRGARLVTASETEEDRAWAESRIKSLTGGDPISARFMRQDFFTFTPQFKLMIVGNHKPVLRNVDEAARRRFNIVPFTQRPAAPDRQLESKLVAEGPGILRWMIEGCLDWQEHGLVRPSSVVAETSAYFDDQDLFGQWLDDECDCEVGNPHKWETSAMLFEAWQKFAAAAGERPGSKKAFSEMLSHRHFEPHRGAKGTRLFRGIRLIVKGRRPDGDPD